MVVERAKQNVAVAVSWAGVEKPVNPKFGLRGVEWCVGNRHDNTSTTT